MLEQGKTVRSHPLRRKERQKQHSLHSLSSSAAREDEVENSGVNLSSGRRGDGGKVF